jgi:hypothetical protein
MSHIQPDYFPDCVDGRIEAAIGSPWVALGRDLSGFDCWGFVRYGLNLTDAPNAPFFDKRERPNSIREFSKAFIRVKDKTPYSILLLGTHDQFHHVGIYTPSGFVYHCMEKIGVCGHKFRSLGILGFDSYEFYQWGSNAENPEQKQPIQQS